MDGSTFLTELAVELADELRPNERIKTFTTNSVLIGAYAEACVRRLIERIISPLRVSTGAVVSEQICSNPSTVPQLDVILWSPSPVPALFNVGSFGLIPRSSAFGIMEIKRTDYDSGVDNLIKVFEGRGQFDLVADIAKTVEVKDGNKNGYVTHPGLGVICLQEKKKLNGRLQALRDEGCVVVLLNNSGKQIEVNAEDVHKLVNFLASVRLRARLQEGRDYVNLELLNGIKRQI